ncbi:uncharacterized protein LOC134278482 [Saccostrea cucullata]|uniref:uncharacterized protein LOC134278481 n=1 Tax=Saccostrea cuccullata TaxID=36930 RepID=UPI002ED18C24
MSEVLDLNVPDEEMEALCGEDMIQKEWPSEGDTCQIQNCPLTNHTFHKIGSYRAHFIKYHKARVPVYYCYSSSCSFSSFKMNMLRRHMRAKHSSLQGCWNSSIIDNPRFVNPGRIGMPLPTIHREARDVAARARQCAVKPLFNLQEWNARDQKPHFF